MTQESDRRQLGTPGEDGFGAAPGFPGHRFVRPEATMVKSGMNKIDRRDVDDGPVVSEGGRSPSTLSTGMAWRGVRPGAGALAPGQRWSVSRKREVVLRLLRGESTELLSRESGVPLYKLEQWRRRPTPLSTAR